MKQRRLEPWRASFDSCTNAALYAQVIKTRRHDRVVRVDRQERSKRTTSCYVATTTSFARMGR